MARIAVLECAEKTGETVLLAGWVAVRRDHGKLIFIDLRDESGIVQMVFSPKNADAHKKAEALRPEWVIQVTGLVKARPENMQNPDIATGKVEIEVTNLEILNEAETPPFDISGDGRDINEEIRLEYRYLDLRRARLQNNIRLRHKVAMLVREYLTSKKFIEIETPLLTKASPEGARDFLVPSRMHPGKFYALPQAPQQYKQLLMLSGFERYFQIARALRDEDLRGDRQFEHTQIDMEMSYATEKDVRDMVEGLMIHITEACGKKVLQKPFPIFTHEEAIKKFGADKFDLRENKDTNTLAFAWVVDFPLFEWDENTKKYTFAHNPFSAPKAEHVEKLLKGDDLGNLRAQQYDLVCNGFELASGGVRISNPEVQQKVFEIMGLTKEEIENRFGHMLTAYQYGAPPHAGIAPGLDRLIMVLTSEDSIREVQVFPMTSGGRTAVMNAPSEVPKEQLDELGIQLKSKK